MNKPKELPHLKLNAFSNIPNLSANDSHLFTPNSTLDAIFSQLRPKTIKNLEKSKVFKHNHISLNKYRKTFYNNKFFGNSEKIHYNNISHDINSLNDKNKNHNIIYYHNFREKKKYKKDREPITSRGKNILNKNC